MERSVKRYTARRLIAVFLGNILIGIGVAIFRMTLLGNDPSTAFVLALANKVGMALAPMLWICGAGWFLIEIIWGRKFIGLGTFVNWFLLGMVADGVTWVLNHFFTVPEAFLPRFLIMLLTLPVVSLGVSLYQSSELGASPYDSLALILDDLFPKIPYFWCRIAVDGTATLLAWLLGGVVGWGTLACALGLGPFVHFFNKHISEPFCQVPKNEPEPFENAEENGKSA